MPGSIFDDPNSSGRLVASANDQGSIFAGSASPSTPPSATGRLLQGAQYLTSGREFLKKSTGGRLDISGLPDYIETPIDILANPVSIGSMLLAPFTAGTSLAGLGAVGVGARVGGTAATLLAGGLAGGIAAQEVSKLLPEDAPKWLQVGAPLAAGALVGGGTQAAVARRLPGAFSQATRSGTPKETPSGNYGVTDSPFDLPFAQPGKTKLQQVMDVVKGVAKRGEVTNEFTSPIIAQTAKLQRTVQDVKQSVFQPAVALEHTLENNKLFRMRKGKAAGEVPELLVTRKAAAPAPKAPNAEAQAVALQDELEQGLRQYAATQSDEALAPLLARIEANPELADEALTNLAVRARGAKSAQGLVNTGELDNVLGDVVGEAPAVGAIDDVMLDAIETKLLPYAKSQPKNTKLYESEFANARAGVTDDVNAVTKELEETLGRKIDNDAYVVQNADGRFAVDEITGARVRMANKASADTRPTVEKEWVSFADVADNLDDFTLTPEQLDYIKYINSEETALWGLYGAVLGKPLEQARTLGNGGLFVSRGRPVEDGVEELFSGAGRPRALSATPGQAKMRVYKTQGEGFAAGESYPRPSEALAQYYEAVGNATIGRHALNQLKKLKDAEGNPLILDLSRAFPVTDEAGNVVLGANGRPVMTHYTRPVPRGYSSIETLPGMAAEASVARQINQQFNPTGPLAQANKLAEAFNRPFRSLHVAFDLGDFIARIGPTNVMTHPLVFAKAAGKGFAGVFNRSVVGQEFNSINRELLESGVKLTVRDMARLGMRLNQTDFAPGALGKAPVISHLGGVYGNALDIMRARMFQAELLSKVKGGVIDITDEVALRQIASGINITTGASNGKPVSNSTILLQFPNWLQSQIEFLITASSKGGMDGAYARRALVGLVGLGTTAAVVGNKLSGNLESVDDMKKMFETGVPTFRVGDQRINLFGPYASLARGVWAAVNGDPEALIRGRASPLIQTGWDLVTGETFSGQAANFGDAGYWVKSALPYSASSFVREPGVGGVLSAVGVNATTDTPRRQLDRIAASTLGKDYADTTGQEREELRRTHPDIYNELQRRTTERAAAGDRYSTGVLESQKVTEELLNQQEQLVSLLRTGQLRPAQFREALNSTVQAAAIEKRRIRKDFDMDKDTGREPSEIQQGLDKYYALFDEADMGVLNGGQPVGRVNWDEYERRRERLFAELTPLQQKAIEERATPRSPSVKWYYDNRQIISDAGYFETAEQAFDKFAASVKRVAPRANTLNELYIAQNQAVLAGDKSAYAYTSALINQIGAYSEALKRAMRAKDPTLARALVQNGYLAAPKSLAYTP